MHILHNDSYFDAESKFNDFDYVFLDDFQSEPVSYVSQPFIVPRKINGIGIDFNQANFALSDYYTSNARAVQEYLDKFQNIKLEKTYRNTHNIVTQLRTLCKFKKLSFHADTDDRLFKNQFFHTPSYGHFIHGPQLIVNIYDTGNTIKEFMREKLIPRIFSEIVTSGGKTSEKKAEKACILYNDISTEEIVFYSQKYPSVLCSNGGHLSQIASTEFSEFQIVHSINDSYSNLKLSVLTIKLILSELQESKIILSTLSITDEMEATLNEPLELLDKTISMLDFVETLAIPPISSEIIEEIDLHGIRQHLDYLQELLNVNEPISKLLQFYQTMREAFEIIIEILPVQESYKNKRQEFDSLPRSQLNELRDLEKHFKELLSKFDLKVIEADLDELLRMGPPSDPTQEQRFVGLMLTTMKEARSLLHAFNKRAFAETEIFPFNFDSITTFLQRTIKKLKGVQNESTEFSLLHNNIRRLESCMMELTKDTVNSVDNFESLLSMLFNTISRTRVLCRIHLAYEKLCPTSTQVAEDFWRKIFPDARIRFINI